MSLDYPFPKRSPSFRHTQRSSTSLWAHYRRVGGHALHLPTNLFHAFFRILPSRSTPARQRMDTWYRRSLPTRNWKCAVSTLDKWMGIKQKTKVIVLDSTLQSCLPKSWNNKGNFSSRTFSAKTNETMIAQLSVRIQDP